MSQHYKDSDAACVYCGRHSSEDNPITAGHIVARSKGGTNDPSNYQPECRRCGSAKGAA
ncbi:HNH endonuclease [Nonomuraea sp. NPDC050790]|uniref:HNH endonuclease n=1 Tax=Nonomuraea sp. NPDC050790 TaxID=3364371 RepID=UPI00379882D1